jgi:hypothetical protein
MATEDGYLTWNPEDAIAQLQLECDALDIGNPVDTARSILADASTKAAASIAHLAVHSRDEKVRLSAARYILDKTIINEGQIDTFAELLKSMTN